MPNKYPAVASGPLKCPVLRSTVTVQLHARDTDSLQNVVEEKPHVVRYLLGTRDTSSDLADDDDNMCGMIESLPLTPSSITTQQTTGLRTARALNLCSDDHLHVTQPYYKHTSASNSYRQIRPTGFGNCMLRFCVRAFSAVASCVVCLTVSFFRTVFLHCCESGC